MNLNSSIGILLDDVASLPTCFVIFGATPRHSARKKRLDIDQSPTRYKRALASTGCTTKQPNYISVARLHISHSYSHIPMAPDRKQRTKKGVISYTASAGSVRRFATVKLS